MEALAQVLPIIIYFLLIIVIIIGIILGIKLIITIDSIQKLIDDVNDKIEKVSPIFNFVESVTNKVGGVVGTVVSGLENVIYKLFVRKNDMEDEEDE